MPPQKDNRLSDHELEQIREIIVLLGDEDQQKTLKSILRTHLVVTYVTKFLRNLGIAIGAVWGAIVTLKVYIAPYLPAFLVVLLGQ